MKQSEKLTQLLELMQANPELPVVPCVDGMLSAATSITAGLAHGERARFRSSSSAKKEPTTGRTTFAR